ncbi:sugar ABC transporter substrate-binding protein [Gorillibacterium sp. sgz500922]|uniref:sugar ABC transporter substrate-binding protein n=1 Tax=Gorillibacterium sp. sgz500922 TaxID=3446694 RepID=UPI003F67CEF2
MESKAPEPADGFTYGIIYPMAHEFYQVITEGAETAAARDGSRVIARAPDDPSVEQQIRITEQMIKEKVDGIAISPIDSDALIPVIKKAVQAGIPVICFESDAPDSGRTAYIGIDNRQAGAKLGESVNALLRGKGMILVQAGFDRMLGSKLRVEGLLDYIRTRTEIQVLDVRYNRGDEAQAYRDLEQMIDEHPHFDAFVALDFISGTAAILTWKASGLDRYLLIFSQNKEIQNGSLNGQVTSVVSQHESHWGEMLVDYLRQARLGHPIPSNINSGLLVHSQPVNKP